MSRAAQSSLRAVAAASCRRKGHPLPLYHACTTRKSASLAPLPFVRHSTSALAASVAVDDNLDPYPDTTDAELLSSLQLRPDQLELADIYSTLNLTPFPIDYASAYICLRLRPTFPQLFPTLPLGTVVNLLKSCSQRGLSRVAHRIVDDVLQYRKNESAVIQAVLGIPPRELASDLSPRHVVALYEALAAIGQREPPELSFDAAKRVIRAYMVSEEDSAVPIIVRLAGIVLESPQCPTEPAQNAWIVQEVICYLASEGAFAEAVQLLQRMITKNLLPGSAVQEMQLVDRSHPEAAGIVVLSAVIRACLEWQWLDRAMNVAEELKREYLEPVSVPVPTSTIELLEELCRTLLLGDETKVSRAGRVLVGLSRSPNFPPISSALLDLFYERAVSMPIMVQLYHAMDRSHKTQPSPPPAAIIALGRKFCNEDYSKRSVASLIPHVNRTDPTSFIPFRALFLLLVARIGLRAQAERLYRDWSADSAAYGVLTSSKVMLALVKVFMSTEKAEVRPYNSELAQIVIRNYLEAIPSASFAGIAHPAALRLARAFFLVGSDSSAMKLFDHILLDRTLGIDAKDVGSLIVSIASTRPAAAADLLKRADRWGVDVDRGTYEACIKAAIGKGDVQLAESIESMAQDKGVHPEAKALVEADLLGRIEQADAKELGTIVQQMRRARKERATAYQQISERAVSQIIMKASRAGEWRLALEAFRDRLKPRTGEALPARAETLNLVEPLLQNLHDKVRESHSPDLAMWVYGVRTILADQRQSKTRDALVERCNALLSILGFVVKPSTAQNPHIE